MDDRINELKKLKGVGTVLSRRLVESNYDTIAKVAAAEINELERIAGMKPHKVRVILKHSRQMTGEGETGGQTWVMDGSPFKGCCG